MLHQNIISMLGLQSLPDEQKTALLERATDIIQKSVTLRILQLIPENKKEEFVNATAQGNNDLVSQHIAQYAPNFQDILAEEIVRVKQEMQKAVQK